MRHEEPLRCSVSRILDVGLTLPLLFGLFGDVTILEAAEELREEAL